MGNGAGISLLHNGVPRGTAHHSSPEPYPELPSAVLEDLRVREIIDRVASKGVRSHTVRRFFSAPLGDREAIEDRNRLFAAVRGDGELRRGLRDLLPRLRELSMFSRSSKEIDKPLLQAVWRIGELELFVEVMEGLANALPADHACRSLADLRRYAAEAAGRPEIVELKKELPEIKRGLKSRRSVTVGINLDSRFRPVEATLLGISEKPFREQSFLAGFLGKLSAEDVTTTTLYHNTESDDIDETVPLAPLFADLDRLLKSMSRPLFRLVDKYTSVNTGPLAGLADELALILALCDLLDEMEALGLPLALPTFGPARKITELYNLSLALSHGDVGTIVPNDVVEEDGELTYLVTGPNRGGKTTFIQAVGQAQLLAHVGLPVPARQATLPLHPGILTHFPRPETEALERGRFGEEMERLSEISDQITPGCLLILNETFSSTGRKEALAVSEDVLDALEGAEVTTYFSTHLSGHEPQPHRVNLVAEAEDKADGGHRRTFVISRSDHAGRSYAEDIARQYGVDREGLRRRLRKAGITSDAV